jgi:hypothetical protein
MAQLSIASLPRGSISTWIAIAEVLGFGFGESFSLKLLADISQDACYEIFVGTE